MEDTKSSKKKKIATVATPEVEPNSSEIKLQVSQIGTQITELINLRHTGMEESIKKELKAVHDHITIDVGEMRTRLKSLDMVRQSDSQKLNSTIEQWDSVCTTNKLIIVIGLVLLGLNVTLLYQLLTLM